MSKNTLTLLLAAAGFLCITNAAVANPGGITRVPDAGSSLALLAVGACAIAGVRKYIGK